MNLRVWWVAMATAGAFAVVACSGSEGDDDDTTSSSGGGSSSGVTGFDGNIPSTGGSEARCVFPEQDAQCTDWRGWRAPNFMVPEGVCTSAQGTFTAGETCPTEKRLGGCQTTMGDGSKQTNWFYQGTKYPDRAAVEAKCAEDDDVVFVTE